jgi:hypothetical protein
MVCLGVAECMQVHRTALDYFLAVLLIVAAVVALRLLISAVAHCLKDACCSAAHHHHHHQHSPATTDEDVDVWAATELGNHLHADRQSRQERRTEFRSTSQGPS